MEVVGEEVRNIGPDFQGVTYTLLLLGCGVHSASRGCIQSKTWCMSRLKLILSHGQLLCQLSALTTKKRGGVGKSLLLV